MIQNELHAKNVYLLNQNRCDFFHFHYIFFTAETRKTIKKNQKITVIVIK